MKLQTKPVAANGFIFDGSLRSMIDLQVFLELNNYGIDSVNMNADKTLQFTTNMVYFKKGLEEPAQKVYANAIIKPMDVVVINSTKFTLEILNKDQFESTYDVLPRD